MKEPVKEIVIGEVKKMGRMQQKLVLFVEKGKDSLYAIFYQNARYSSITDIESISFGPEDDTFEKLYTTLKGVFTKENEENKDYKIQFMLGKTDITVEIEKVLGTVYARVWCSDGYFYITEKNLDKLFEK